MADDEYESLAKRLEALRNATDPALARERSELQKKLADILVSRRRSDRFQCHLKVELRGAEPLGEGVVTNLGAGGAYVRTAAQVERFSNVTLVVTTLGRLPAGTELPGNVRWVKPGDGVGIRFDLLEPAAGEALRRALGELVREQPPKAAQAAE